jgi:TetR/AcrR family transcriptional regulator
MPSVKHIVQTAIRDPERTRERILAAALTEFSHKGFSGARVDAVASRARVNKRMLYHYFGDKEGLFREVLRQKMAERAAWLAASPMNPVEFLPFWFELACSDPDWVRLLQWEALQVLEKKLIDKEKRRATLARAVDKVREQQKAGFLRGELDPRHLLLSLVALTTYPLAFPQIAKLITGYSVTDPEFKNQRLRFLRRFAESLWPQGGRTKPRRSSSKANFKIGESA